MPALMSWCQYLCHDISTDAIISALMSWYQHWCQCHVNTQSWCQHWCHDVSTCVMSALMPAHQHWCHDASTSALMPSLTPWCQQTTSVTAYPHPQSQTSSEWITTWTLPVFPGGFDSWESSGSLRRWSRSVSHHLYGVALQWSMLPVEEKREPKC